MPGNSESSLQTTKDVDVGKLIAVTAYFRREPEKLFEFLKKHMDSQDKEVPVHLWVDNDDHKTSSQFYALRKLIRSGLNLKTHINPPLKTEREVYNYLEEQARKT
jgi:hypothetical protein